MEQLVAQFPKHITDALEIASNALLFHSKSKNFRNVVVCGMGGSGMGGFMISKLCEQQSKVPIVLTQDYLLPAFVDENTLVIGSSYSGSTEETLSALKDAQRKGAYIIGISSGGDLIRWCKEYNYDNIQLPGGNPPRSMLAFSFIQLVYILHQANIISVDLLEDVKKCRGLLNNELIEIKNKAKELAEHFYQKQGVLYSDAPLEPISIRARQQFNENSKQLVWHHIIPEMNHNELVGWGGGNDHYAVVFFISRFLSERNKLRTELTQEIVRGKTSHVLTINGKGNSLVEEYFYFIHIIDWASCYLAELNNKDPFEISVIENLKGNLKKHNHAN